MTAIKLATCPMGHDKCSCVKARKDAWMAPNPEQHAQAIEAVSLAHARLQTIEELRTQASRDRAIACWHAHRVGVTYGQIAAALGIGRPTVIALVQRGEAEVADEHEQAKAAAKAAKK